MYEPGKEVRIFLTHMKHYENNYLHKKNGKNLALMLREYAYNLDKQYSSFNDSEQILIRNSFKSLLTRLEIDVLFHAIKTPPGVLLFNPSLEEDLSYMAMQCLDFSTPLGEKFLHQKNKEIILQLIQLLPKNTQEKQLLRALGWQEKGTAYVVNKEQDVLYVIFHTTRSLFGGTISEDKGQLFLIKEALFALNPVHQERRAASQGTQDSIMKSEIPVYSQSNPNLLFNYPTLENKVDIYQAYKTYINRTSDRYDVYFSNLLQKAGDNTYTERSVTYMAPKELLLDLILNHQDQDEKQLLLEASLDKQSLLGKIFYTPRGPKEPSIHSGCLKQLHAELTMIRGENYEDAENLPRIQR